MRRRFENEISLSVLLAVLITLSCANGFAYEGVTDANTISNISGVAVLDADHPYLAPDGTPLSAEQAAEITSNVNEAFSNAYVEENTYDATSLKARSIPAKLQEQVVEVQQRLAENVGTDDADKYTLSNISTKRILCEIDKMGIMYPLAASDTVKIEEAKQQLDSGIAPRNQFQNLYGDFWLILYTNEYLSASRSYAYEFVAQITNNIRPNMPPQYMSLYYYGGEAITSDSSYGLYSDIYNNLIVSHGARSSISSNICVAHRIYYNSIPERAPREFRLNATTAQNGRLNSVQNIYGCYAYNYLNPNLNISFFYPPSISITPSSGVTPIFVSGNYMT